MTGFASLPLAESGPPAAHLAGVSKIRGPAWLRMPALTVGLLGVQVLWSVEMSYASPYLLSLGLSKSWMAMVFLAGPLSGLIVQPVIGVLADGSTSRWGRRRPYMLGGAVLCLLAMLLLGYTRPVANWFTRMGTGANDTLTIWLAVLAIYCIDFSINAVQAMDRALIVDTLPPAQQAAGNAWAARMMGVGGIAGFFVGNIDLPSYLPFLGRAQLGALSSIAALFLFGTHAATAGLVQERVLLVGGASAWLGWFPILFYTTVYVGDIYKRNVPATVARDDALDAEATRLGSRALLCSAIVTLAGNLVLPFCISAKPSAGRGRRGWAGMHLATLFVGSVPGATVLVAVTGGAWAVTQWAPFSLLGEAILSEPTPERGGGAISVADLRHQPASGDGDEQEHFLVVSAEDADSDEDDEGDEDKQKRAGGRGVMGNAGAQLSMLDVHAMPGEEYQIRDSDDAAGEGEGLSAKAGIILASATSIHTRPSVSRLTRANPSRAFTTSALSSRSSSSRASPQSSSRCSTPTIDTGEDVGPGTLLREAEVADGEGAGTGVDTVALIFRTERNSVDGFADWLG
ncbi:hypothetical protein HWV62_45505 [Athelia sp. TMB]|nr:hypothetical protein HWV62_45505 [Athelia sp. TMB]